MNSPFGTHTSLLRSERIVHAVMAALAAMSLIGCYTLRRQISESVENIVASKEECIDLCDLEAELTASIANTRSELDQLELDYRSALGRIPQKIIDSELLSSIRGVAQASHCSLLNFRPLDTQNQSDFQTRSFELHLEGKFNDIYQFFDSLSSVPYVYHVRRLKISEPSMPGGACKIDLELKVVFNHVYSKSETR